MGNKIKDLDEIKFGGQIFKVELNGGTKNEVFDIHLQNDNMSICMKDYEFSEFVATLMVARRRMERFKKKYE